MSLSLLLVSSFIISSFIISSLIMCDIHVYLQYQVYMHSNRTAAAANIVNERITVTALSYPAAPKRHSCLDTLQDQQ